MKHRLIVLLFLCGFFFSNLDLHADHDGTASANDDQCCIQCCPSHNLAPAHNFGTISKTPKILPTFFLKNWLLPLQDVARSIFKPPILLS